MNDSFISGFLKTLRILKDYLSEIVIGGGRSTPNVTL